MSAVETGTKDIVETAVAAGQFSTLTTALQAAGLADALKGEGPFTVFAPTDEAFSKLPEGALDDLLKPDNQSQLQAILKYHVASGKAKADDVVGMDSVETLQGQSLPIAVSGSTVKVGDATVIQADIECSNGVIHVIDNVLVP
ncbi:MAG: fasciclin domain-containing protein [Planctomycetota bacterium]